MIANSSANERPPDRAAEVDVVIRNGLFFDGSGQLPMRADVAIDGGKVKTSGGSTRRG